MKSTPHRANLGAALQNGLRNANMMRAFMDSGCVAPDDIQPTVWKICSDDRCCRLLRLKVILVMKKGKNFQGG